MIRKLASLLVVSMFVFVAANVAMAQDQPAAEPAATAEVDVVVVDVAPCVKVKACAPTCCLPCCKVPVCKPVVCCPATCCKPCCVPCPPPCYKVEYRRGLFGCCRPVLVQCNCGCCESADPCNFKYMRVGCFRTVRICCCDCYN